MPYGGLPKANDWIDSTLVASNQAYRVSTNRETALRDAYPKVEIAMSRSDVEKLMSWPDFESVQIQSSGGRPTGICFTQWAYIFSKGDTNPISLNDAATYHRSLQKASSSGQLRRISI